MSGVSNIRPRAQNKAGKDSNLADWKALENVKKCTDFKLLTVFSQVLQLCLLIQTLPFIPHESSSVIDKPLNDRNVWAVLPVKVDEFDIPGLCVSVKVSVKVNPVGSSSV